MAATGKAALDVSVFAEIVQAEMVPELRPAMTSREFLRFATGGPSTVVSFPLWGDPGSAAAPTNDLSDIDSTALSDTQVQATAAPIKDWTMLKSSANLPVPAGSRRERRWLPKRDSRAPMRRRSGRNCL